MIDNVLQISREQMEKAIEILNPCMNDYIYVYDLIDDYYVISGHAVDRFILPEDKFYDAAAKHKEFVYADDYEMLSKELQDIKDGKKVFHNMKYRWCCLKMEDHIILWAVLMRLVLSLRQITSAVC